MNAETESYDQSVMLKTVTILPILPSISYTAKF